MAENERRGPSSVDEWAATLAELESRPPRATQEAVQQVKLFPDPAGESTASVPPGRLDRVLDIPLQLTVELGRTKLPIRDLLQVAPGAVIELDRLAGEPLDLLVNGCLVAQGEVVVINDRFGIRLTGVVAPDERLRRLGR